MRTLRDPKRQPTHPGALLREDVYLEIKSAAWQRAPLGAVAAGLGLTLAEMLRRYPRARGVHDAARKAAERAPAIPGWSWTPEGLLERTAPPPGLRVYDVLIIEQRNVWRRLAPEDIPNPFGQHWWCQMQMLGWVYYRDPDVVRAAAPPEPFESTLTRKELRNLGRNGACYPHFADAENAAIEALRAGRLTATGLLNGERDDRKEIPPLSWADLVFRFEPYYFAGPKDPTRTRPYWDDLQFPRKEVLAIWADPLGLPANADEQKTSTTAEQNETPEKRHARILARHKELKAAGNRRPTKTVAEEEGFSENWIRQLIRKARKSH